MIFSMLIKSVVSYSIFLASRKIVRETMGIDDTLKKTFKLHRCTCCWKLYSGELNKCNFCGEFVKPLYEIHEEEAHSFYDNQTKNNKHEQGEKFTYNNTSNVEFKPSIPSQLEAKDDRSTRATDTKPSRDNQRRNTRSTRNIQNNRVFSNRNI